MPTPGTSGIPGTSSSPPVHLLVVCTGNICRSPYAAALLGDRLARVRPGAFEVGSAGTHAIPGVPIDPGSARILQGHGVDTGDRRSRRLTAQLAGSAQIVLLMSPEHRAVVVDEQPAAHRRTFLFREFAHQLEAVGQHRDWPALFERAGAGDDVVGRWSALPAILAVEGPLVRRRRRDAGVLDPVGGPQRAFARMAAEINPAVDQIAAWEAQFPR